MLGHYEMLVYCLLFECISFYLNQSQLWSVLRIAMGTEIASQEYVTVFQDSWGRTALEVNMTHANGPLPQWRQ